MLGFLNDISIEPSIILVNILGKTKKCAKIKRSCRQSNIINNYNAWAHLLTKMFYLHFLFLRAYHMQLKTTNDRCNVTTTLELGVGKKTRMVFESFLKNLFFYSRRFLWTYKFCLKIPCILHYEKKTLIVVFTFVLYVCRFHTYRYLDQTWSICIPKDFLVFRIFWSV
jgi:hypothetical protein